MFASLIYDKQCDLFYRAVCTFVFCGRYKYIDIFDPWYVKDHLYNYNF